MVQWMKRSVRKPSGSKYSKKSKKKKYQRGRDFVPATIGGSKVSKKRARGGNQKLIVFRTEIANVIMGGKAKKAKIISVTENPADPHYVRRNIITKGAIIETDLGKVR
ncbi:MAG: 30S ribosomal protein S8e, partial [Candidatus Aenigmatarchaeota archaeon]